MAFRIAASSSGAAGTRANRRSCTHINGSRSNRRTQAIVASSSASVAGSPTACVNSSMFNSRVTANRWHSSACAIPPRIVPQPSLRLYLDAGRPDKQRGWPAVLVVEHRRCKANEVNVGRFCHRFLEYLVCLGTVGTIEVRHFDDGDLTFDPQCPDLFRRFDFGIALKYPERIGPEATKAAIASQAARRRSEMVGHSILARQPVSATAIKPTPLASARTHR